MDDDQQFCLRWNNHQSTLVSVFDNLLENGTLVDCTLFAEGKYLKAHKVVLSACSPYFEALLTQQYDKHPIFILKDVKYQELKAMMDYMYRGEVNISQDQLAALLKAAESLQIKGLSDSRSGKESEPRKSAPPPPAKTPPPAPAPTIPRVQGLTIEQRKAPKLSESMIEDSRSREGSTSPVPRKRKKPRRRPSQEGVNDNHDASSSSESHSNQAPASIPSLPASVVPLASTSKLTDVPESTEVKPDAGARKVTGADSPQVPIKEKQEIHSELILEPKAEYIEDEMNEDSVEDLTLDDDDVSQMEQEMDHARPGPSHGTADGSVQGFGGWHMQGNQTQDEVFLAAQEAVGAHRDSQELPTITIQKPVKRPSCVKIISVENAQIIGDIKKELSTHLTFDKVNLVKTFNQKIISKDVTLKKVPTILKNRPVIIVKKDEDNGNDFLAANKSIASCRMEKFLAMSAADCNETKRSNKLPACLNPVLKTPKDTIRCSKCNVLYDPTRKQDHLKVCANTKPVMPSYGCLLCSFKSNNRDETAEHVKNFHS